MELECVKKTTVVFDFGEHGTGMCKENYACFCLSLEIILLQVLRAFGIPQRKHLYFISVSGHFRDIVTPYPQLE